MKTESLEARLGEMMRHETLQTVVHDLRTPITVIKGNLELLLSGIMGELSAEQMKLLERSVGPLEDLILMTENLLQVPKLESGEMTLTLQDVDLDQILAEAIDFYQTPFRQRGMQLYRQGNSQGLRLHVDAFWLRRVLHNLIWNAYKFTPDNGQVFVHVQRQADGVDLVVEDTGCGIPSDKLLSIFEKFEQVQTLRDRRMGTGLGLWICKKVLELHGGTIHVESRQGQGSRFILFFPAERVL